MKKQRIIPEKVVEERFCDVCGKPADGCGFIVAHSVTGEVIYESKIVGDYCTEHADRLLSNALTQLPIHERYDTIADEEAAIKAEIELIEKEV